MDGQTNRVVVKVPDKTSRGFLRRQIATLEYAAAWQAARTEADEVSTPESLQRLMDAWTKTVDHILQFVVEPTDKSLAREWLLDASEDEIDKILAVIRGDDATPPLSTSPSSETG
jgi:hypothetical protein